LEARISIITLNLRERGEFQLSTVLDRLRQYDGLHGLMIDGDRFDIGIPDITWIRWPGSIRGSISRGIEGVGMVELHFDVR
jgi:hypothetical protein